MARLEPKLKMLAGVLVAESDDVSDRRAGRSTTRTAVRARAASGAPRLRASGAEWGRPASVDSRNFQNVARQMAHEEGWFLTDQFCNPANVRAHEETTGPEIYEQCDGRIGAFVAGAGTGGTITGVGRYLKERAPGVRVYLADPIGSGLARWAADGVVGPDAPYLVEGIGTSKPPDILDRTVIDGAESVSDDESFAMSRRLWREEGLYVGGSAGTAVVAALRVAARGTVTSPVVVLLPDSWDRYLSTPWASSVPSSKFASLR